MGDDVAAGRPPEKKGGGLFKWCFACCCLVFIIMGFIGGYGFFLLKQSISMDPVTVASRVNGFLPSKIPAGYSGQFAFHVPFQSVDFAIIAPDGALQSGRSQADQLPLMIMVVNPPPGTKLDNMDDAKKQFQQSQGLAGGVGGGAGGATQVEADPNAPAPAGAPVRKLKVRGEDVEVLDTLGKTQQGNPIRQVFVLVPKTKGSSDKVIIVGMGNADQFDQAAFDAFVTSIQ